MSTTSNTILIITTTLAAIMAGLFFAYSFSVNPGLHRLADKEYLSAMQSINRAIQNPVFFIFFLGILVCLPLCTWLHYGQPDAGRFRLILAATIIYAIGTFGVTAFINVPLNEALDKFNIAAASAEQISAQRTIFEQPWNNWNLVRTITSAITVILLIIACTTHGNNFNNKTL